MLVRLCQRGETYRVVARGVNAVCGNFWNLWKMGDKIHYKTKEIFLIWKKCWTLSYYSFTCCQYSVENEQKIKFLIDFLRTGQMVETFWLYGSFSAKLTTKCAFVVVDSNLSFHTFLPKFKIKYNFLRKIGDFFYVWGET